MASIASLATVAVGFGAWVVWNLGASESPAHPAPSEQSGFENRTSGAQRNDKEKRTAASLLADMRQGKECPKPTREQLEAFIEQEGRSARSLVAAFMLSTEEVPWLDEAAERYPEDPIVSAMMLQVSKSKNALSAEWVQRMQQNDPKNSLGWCYAGLASLKAGDKEEAMMALEDATSRGRPHMYHEEMTREVIKAYKSAGFDALHAEVLAAAHVPVGLAALHALTHQLKSDPQGFMSPASENLLTLATSLREDRGGSYAIEHLVARSIESTIANATEWYEEVPGTNMMAVELQEKSRQESRMIGALGREYERLLPSLTDTELKQYLRRVKVEGEVKAMQWVVQTKGKK